MKRQRIYTMNGAKVNDNDRLELANMLVKFGYCVKIGKERPQGKTTGAFTYYVEYWSE